MSRCHFQRAACRQLFVRVGHHEPAGIELARGLLDVFLVGMLRAVARDIHRPRVGFGVAVDHPFGKALAHAAALQEPGHHRAGGPVATLARHRPHQRVAIGAEGEGPVDPRLDPHILGRWIAGKAQHQLILDPVEIFLKQLHPVVPRRAVHGPVLVLDLVNADQDALLVLPHIGEPFEVHGHGHLEIMRGHLRNLVGDQVVGFTYMRQDQKGILIGIYEIEHEHWAMDGAPWNYGMELFKEDLDRIENELTLGFARYPAAENVGIKTWVNGAFTFSPDGNPLVGPVPGKRGYWSACAVMAGFLQGGGVGKSLAEWMIEGEPEADVWCMDVARYGKFAENKQYIKETTGQFYSRRFVMTYPNEQLPAGRPLKTSPAHSDMTAAGCRWGNSWDLETPLYFAPEGFEETPTLKRSNAFEFVKAECKNARENVGMVDITGFSRFEVSGPNAEAWLNKMMASKLPGPGRARLAPMLSPEGRLKGDLTVMNWGDGTWWIMGSYYLRTWHMRWFNDYLVEGVNIRDLGEEICGFALTGPNSRKVLENLGLEGISELKFMQCAPFDVGMIRTRIARMSVAGEMGFEINCRYGDHINLRKTLLAAGADLGLQEYGFNAMLSLRLEKSFGIWSAEFTQAYTPGMTGMDRWIDWEKDFVGKAAAEAERDGNGPAQKLVTLEIDSTDADASGYEPIWKDGKRVGFVTSGGYGHTVEKSLAMALVDAGEATEGNALSVHVVGVEHAARVIPASPYDPKGEAMRG